MFIVKAFNIYIILVLYNIVFKYQDKKRETFLHCCSVYKELITPFRNWYHLND